MKTYERLTEGQYDDPQGARPDLPATVCSLVRRCMSRAPDDRPGHISQVAAELRSELISRGTLPSYREIGSQVVAIANPDPFGDVPSACEDSDAGLPTRPRWSTEVEDTDPGMTLT